MAPYLMTETALYLHCKNIIVYINYFCLVKIAPVFCDFLVFLPYINYRANKFPATTVWTEVAFDN